LAAAGNNPSPLRLRARSKSATTLGVEVIAPDPLHDGGGPVEPARITAVLEGINRSHRRKDLIFQHA
jgi:hypothetical protein